MKKLSIAIDMGAKYNGIFIVKTENEKIVNRKASCIIINKGTINFSKKSRRENRHKERNYKRRKLAKRLLEELIDFSKYDEKKIELINGLLNNRGYTFLSSSTKFEQLDSETSDFVVSYLSELSNYNTKDEFEEFFTNEFEDDKDLVKFLELQIKGINKISDDLQNYSNRKKILIDLESLKNKNITEFKSFSYIKNLLFSYGYSDLGKNEKEITISLKKDNFDYTNIDFDKEFYYINELTFTKESEVNRVPIIKNLKELKDFLIGIKKEIDTGSKTRKKYIKDIKEEIDSLNFIENKEKFLNLIANISNLQLRVLRKFFNINSQKNDRYEILKKYFISHHYKKESEKETKKNLLKYLDDHSDLLDFLQSTPPNLTIPPYEDMNNRNTYKCNSMLVKPELISDELKNTIDTILKNNNFSKLLIGSDGEFIKEELIKTKPATHNTYIKTDFTYSKYLQRILDATPDITTKELNPRNVFKYMKSFNRGTISSVKEFKTVFGDNIYFDLEKIATLYYKEETKIYGGIYEESTSIFTKCNTNTSYKNNVKHTLLKPIYSYGFTTSEADNCIDNIKDIYGLKKQLELISSEAKKYQNNFYNIVLSCFENKQYVNDKEIQKIIKNLPATLKSIRDILDKQNIKTTFLHTVENITSENISRVLNIFKQTYNILFDDLSGFSKTCKNCTKENTIRSDENFTIGKRLLSDVAKPIDGMLDMMLDRLSYEIIKDISKSDIQDIDNLEILLEQNRFKFEDGLNDIKGKKTKKRENKDKLKSITCPYINDENINIGDYGEYDHILPQSKELYNSKANLIYCSSKGNREKSNSSYKLENLNSKHLKEVFAFDDLDKIKEFITVHIKTININEFKNFDNLKLNQKKAFRYALFMPNSSTEYKKAFNLVKIDKLKTFSNGTQKRLARFIYEKLVKKYPNEFKNNMIEVNSKTIDNMLVSATRKSLSSINEDLKKEKYQDNHSHCIDAIIVFYLANAKINGRADKKKENLTTMIPYYSFDDIYLKESSINNLSKNVTFINSSKKERGAYKLFDNTIYSEQYKHITTQNTDKKDLESLIKYNLLFVKGKGKKKKIELSQLKFLDKLQYFTSRKEIQTIGHL